MPSETSVSIVVARCRRLTNAARWNGHAHHRATGVARTKATRRSPGNSRPGTMPSAMTGTASATAQARRRRRAARAASAAEGAGGAGGGGVVADAAEMGGLAPPSGRPRPPIVSPSTRVAGAVSTEAAATAVAGAPL